VVAEHDTGRLYVSKFAAVTAVVEEQDGDGNTVAVEKLMDGPVLELEACVVPGSGRVSRRRALTLPKQPAYPRDRMRRPGLTL
jgi:hypothetical protein